MLEIDGSFGEGGGSIVRIAVAMSAVTSMPCKIFDIRAKRRVPGLQAQHLAAVNAVGKLCNADIRGNEIGSTEIEFYPREIVGGSLSINVGTAGSTALVLQALMIAAAHSTSVVDIKIAGGTLNRWAPSIYYLQNVTLPLLRKVGYKADIILKRHGFYPRGGGMVEAVIQPSKILPIELLKRGKAMQVKGIALASSDLAKPKVSERMQKTARDRLFKVFGFVPEIKAEYTDTLSTGGGIDLVAVYESSIIGASALAEPGKSAEKVAKEALDSLIQSHDNGAPLDRHMEDQFIPYMALAGGGAIKAAEITEHTRTNIWVCEQFLPVKFEIDEREKIIRCES